MTETPPVAGLRGGVLPKALLREAQRMFTGPVRFELSAPTLEALPAPGVPEVAFAGRSNVGKSTLLNALAGRRGLARTSNTPGRTQQLNFFAVGEPPALRLVDMPGYGYAEAPKAVVRKWARLTGDYLRGRAALARVLLLIDIRRGLRPVDREIMDLLDQSAVSYQIVLTKTDKVKVSAAEAVCRAVEEEARRHAAAHPHLVVTSAEKMTGIAELRAAVLIAAFPERLKLSDEGE